MKTGDKVKIRIKSGVCPSYLTEGKIYEASVNDPENIPQLGMQFSFYDDDMFLLETNQYDSTHLKGGDWEIVE